jgi:hypothetical protein
MTAQVLTKDVHLFDVRPAVEWHLMDSKTFIGHAFFVAANPPPGALIDYYLKTKPERRTDLKITILDTDGKVVHELRDLPQEAGLNRVAWDLRSDPPSPANESEGRGGRGGGGGGRGGGRGVVVEPGEYTVRIALDASQVTGKVMVEQDLRVNMTPEERSQRRQAITELFEMAKGADAAQRQFVALRTAVTDLRETWRRSGAAHIPDSVQKAVDDLDRKMSAIEKTPPGRGGGPPGEYIPPPVLQRITTLLNAIDGYAFPPTSGQLAEIPRLRLEMTDADARIKQLIDEDLPTVNKSMNDAGVPHISVTEQTSGATIRRRQ